MKKTWKDKNSLYAQSADVVVGGFGYTVFRLYGTASGIILVKNPRCGSI